MKKNIEIAIKAILETDETVSSEQLKSALNTLNESNNRIDGMDCVLSRSEVAKIMGKSVKAIDIYGRKGIIKRVYLTGGGSQRVQSQGYSKASVIEALNRQSKVSDFKSKVDVQKDLEEADLIQPAIDRYGMRSKILSMNVTELDISIRALNCLNNCGIETVQDLVSKTEADLLKIRNMGRKSLVEIERCIVGLGLSLEGVMTYVIKV